MAARVRARLIEELRGGAAGAGRPRVGEFAALWSEARAGALSSGTRELYANHFESCILPDLGDVYLDALTGLDVQAWVTKLGRRLAPSTVKVVFGLFRAMMVDAVAQLGLERDPTMRIRLPEGVAKRKRTLSEAELGALVAGAREHEPRHYALIASLAFTGLRFTHVAGWRWPDVDEEAGVIHLERRVYRRDVAPVGRRKRAPATYPLVPEHATILREHRQAMIGQPGVEEGWCFPAARRSPRGHRGEHAYMPVAISTVASVLERLAERLGLGDGITPHVLRYTWKDITRRANVSALVAQHLTGHSDRMHAHYSTPSEGEARSAIAAVANVINLASRRGAD